MEDWLHYAASRIALVIEAFAILVVAYAAAEAIVRVLYAVIGKASVTEQRDIWMQFARWLVAALTFQLAADIVSTAVAPTWDQIGHVAAIAGIRTLLTFFLGRDVGEMRARQGGHDAHAK